MVGCNYDVQAYFSENVREIFKKEGSSNAKRFLSLLELMSDGRTTTHSRLPNCHIFVRPILLLAFISRSVRPSVCLLHPFPPFDLQDFIFYFLSQTDELTEGLEKRRNNSWHPSSSSSSSSLASSQPVAAADEMKWQKIGRKTISVSK